MFWNILSATFQATEDQLAICLTKATILLVGVYSISTVRWIANGSHVPVCVHNSMSSCSISSIANYFTCKATAAAVSKIKQDNISSCFLGDDHNVSANLCGLAGTRANYWKLRDFEITFILAEIIKLTMPL